jgi:hypothetical protein
VHLANSAAAQGWGLYYWRDRNREVDFVAQVRRRLTAIEVKSGRSPTSQPGQGAFAQAFRVHRTLLVGGDGIPVAEFLDRPAEHWLAGGGD